MSLRDPRIEEYARIMVDTCVGVQPGWQVLVAGGVLARPLFDEITRQIARRGAYALLRVGWGGSITGPTFAWAREAPMELLERPAPLDVKVFEEADAFIAVEAPENTRNALALDQERLTTLQVGVRPALERVYRGDVPWTGGQFPTPALAQEAGMATDDFADFLYGACLLDWDAERARMQRYADRFDGAEQVRIVGAETDLTLSIAGRAMAVDAGGRNLPGGEFFTSPVEDSAEGTITFAEFPAVYLGRECRRIRLRFESGQVVEASAEVEDDFLVQMLDTDDGARRLGELGIGCNPRITRHMRNTLFDEKIDGTIHLALGNGIREVGGTNQSAIHWDIVKDLREGGRIELDGEVVQQDGQWNI
ncbi:MAG: aminopeptidase [Thermoleophilia bacterium]|nr:aminopeptidase [Thermoleophilia bacterium]